MAWTRESRRAYRQRNRDRLLAVDRERKRRYAGTCEDCGTPTSGSNGRAKAPRHCYRCAPAHAKIWTREKVVDAMQRYYATYGELSATCFGTNGKWRKLTPERRAELARRRALGHWPTTTSVLAVFDSWNAGLDAAGIPRAHGPIINGKRTVATDVRVCETEGCGTRLSRFNDEPVCAKCEARVLVAGVPVPTPKRLLEALPEPRIAHAPAPVPVARTLCRDTACSAPATRNIGSRGMYGNLCDRHYDERRAQQSAGYQQRAKPGSKTGQRVNGRLAPPPPSGTRRELISRITVVVDALETIERDRLTLLERERLLGDELAQLARALEGAA